MVIAIKGSGGLPCNDSLTYSLASAYPWIQARTWLDVLFKQLAQQPRPVEFVPEPGPGAEPKVIKPKVIHEVPLAA